MSQSTLPNEVYDIFLSYRVGIDSDFVKLIYMRLSTKYRVFFDKECLKCGEDWEAGFIMGVLNSRVFVPIITLNTFRGEKTPYSGRQDNVLLEYEIALELLNQKKGKLKCIYPLLVGNIINEVYQRAPIPQFPENLLMIVNKQKLLEYGPILGVSFDHTASTTVSALFQQLGRIQFRFFTGTFDDASKLLLEDLLRIILPEHVVPVKPQPYEDDAKRTDCYACILACCFAMQFADD